ncbi:MAG: phosphotransferase [Dactylosporangium sp.]|nr:fructosamine kinase family protein [Dactylosporangium sp.]NNJ62604.1 phosphotransferase [Dactylosporangium sp.]
MDLAYFRAHPEHIPAFLLHQRVRETPVSGGSICSAQRLTLDDGASVFAKSLRHAPAGFFAAEAAGLRWLRQAEAVAVPDVIACLPELLVLEWVSSTRPTVRAAERFGRELAALHQAGATTFGASWPGFLGSLPMDNTPPDGPWPAWFAEYRIEPYLRRSADNGALGPDDVDRVRQVLERIDVLAGPAGAEPPARIHGDLWPGNLLWAADRVWAIDPAAHGGHRETDLAFLDLFGGAPHLTRIIDAYNEAFPLADGWRQRVPLHQLSLLLVHTALFGATYRSAVVGATQFLR